MSAGADFVGVADLGLADFVSAAKDVASVVTEFGTEFLADAVDVTQFQVPGVDLTNFGAYLEAGSFAGDAAWVDTFNPASIISSVPGVGEVVQTVSQSLPSLSSIVSSVPSVSEFQGYLKTAQTAISQVAPIAQRVQNLAGYAGIQIPGVQVLNQAAGLVNVTSAGLNTATGIAGTVGKITTAAQAVSTGETSVVSAVKNLVSGAAPVQAGAGLNILNNQQTAALTKNVNPLFINNLVDPGVQSPQNFNSAVQTVDTLTPVVEDLQGQVDVARSSINQENENIANYQNQLDNPDLTAEERAAIEANIQDSYNKIAQAQETIDNTEPLIISTSDQIAQAGQIIAGTNLSTVNSPAAVTTAARNQYRSVYDSATQTWSIINNNTGQTISNALSAAQAAAQIRDLDITASAINLATAATNVDANAAGVNVGTASLADLAIAVDPTGAQGVQNLINSARQQQTLSDLRNNKAQSSDWRVRLRLAPNSTYLYNTPDNLGGPGILAALKKTDGVIFPYTPSIETAYKANYESYDLTHSNYRGYFYKNSYVDAINLRATFTAQDTTEANYLLAVIHFFRSATKMFYGQDQQQGSPPPLVYLSGYGDFQFNEHPCVIAQFNYTMPPDVDYIRAQNTLDVNTNLIGNRIRNPIANNPLAYAANRLFNSGLLPGALDFRPSTANNLPVKSPTYVPTKMEISISLLPIQSRQDVSKNFNLRSFANGNLLRTGYW